MKRQRTTSNSEEEMPSSLTSFEGMISASESSRRRKSGASCSRCSCGRTRLHNGPLFPKSLILGSCLVATLCCLFGVASFSTLPAVDASMASAQRAGSNPRSVVTGLDIIYNNNNNNIDEKQRANHDISRRRRIEGEDDEQTTPNPVDPEDDSSCSVPAGKCMQCTFSEQKTYDVCHKTGRWQKFECIVPSDSNPSDPGTAEPTSSPDTRYEMKSCKYTDFDEGVAMLRLQMFSLLIGSLAIASVRKQKRLSLSMFDRRKQNPARSTSGVVSGNRNNASRLSDNGNDDEDQIEFTPMTNQQRERVPLVEIKADRMEII